MNFYKQFQTSAKKVPKCGEIENFQTFNPKSTLDKAIEGAKLVFEIFTKGHGIDENEHKKLANFVAYFAFDGNIFIIGQNFLSILDRIFYRSFRHLFLNIRNSH